MTKFNLALAVSASSALALLLSLDAQCQQQQNQGCSLVGAPAFGLRTPLVSGGSMGMPFLSAPSGAPPAVGHGPISAPVTPGMGGPPTLYPTNPDTPTDHLGTPTYTVPVPQTTLSRPGELGPSLTGAVPPSPSTPGCDPGMVDGPNGYYPPVAVKNIYAGGGIPYGAPTQKWGGQTTTDWGRYKYRGSRSYDWGQGMRWGQNSQDGPYQSLPGSMSTRDLYGTRGYTQAGCTTFTIAPY